MAVKSLYEVYSNPEFQNLSFEQQQYVKEQWLTETIRSRPDLQRLSREDPATFNDVTSRIMKTAPAMRGYNPLDITDEERAQADTGVVLGERGEWIKGVRLYEKLSADPTNEKLINEARMFAAGNASANESLLYKIADAGLDFLEDTFGKKSGTYSRWGVATLGAPWLKNKQGENLSDRDDLNRLVAAMDATAGRGANQGVGTVKGVAEFGTGFAETVALTMLTVGSGNVVAQGGKIAGKAVAGEAIVGTPGIFTRGLFGAKGLFTKMAAKSTTAAGAAVWKYGAPALTEAVGGGMIDSFRAIPDLIKDGSIKGDKAFWTGLAGTFGRGMAYDLAFNMIGGVVKTALKPFVRVFRKIDPSAAGGLDALEAAARDAEFVSKPENLRGIGQTIIGNINTLPKGAENLSPDVLSEIYKRQNESVVLSSIKNWEFTDPKTMRALARGVADLDFEDLGDGVFKLSRDGFTKTIKGHQETVFEILAQGQARGSYEDEIWEAVGGGRAIPSPLGGNPEARLRSLAKVSRGDVKKMDTATLLAQIPLAQGDSEIFGTQAKGVAQQFLKKAKLANTEQLVSLMPQNLIKPGVFQTATDELRYIDSLEGWLRKVAGPNSAEIPSLRTAFYRDPSRSLSINGLEAAVKRMLPNGRIDALGQNRFRISYGEVGQTPVEEVVTGLRNANKWLGDAAMDAGLVSDDEVAAQFFKQTGMKVEWQEEVADSFGNKLMRPITNDQGIPVYRVRRPNGEIQGGDMFSMKDVVNSQPGFTFRLPDSLTPDFVFNPDGTVWHSQTLLAAPMGKIREIMDGFVPSKGTKVDVSFDGIVNGKNVKVSSAGKVGLFELEISDLGVKRGFATQKAMNEFVNKQARSFDLLKDLAYERGFKVEFARNGTALVRDIESSQIFPMRGEDDIVDWLRKAPDPSVFGKKIFDIEDAIDPDGGFIASLKRTLGEDVIETKPIGDIILEEMGSAAKAAADKKTVDFMFSPARDLYLEGMRIAGPRHETLREMADAFGVPEVVKHINNVQMTSGIVAKQSMKAQQWIKTIASLGGKKATRLERQIASTLVQNAPENWDMVLQNVSKSIKDWTAMDSARAKALASQTTAFMDAWGKVFGIDSYDFMQHYLPKLRNIRSVASEHGFDDSKIGEVLGKLFGGSAEGVRPVQFFAKHGRLNDLIQLGEVDDVVTLMSTYVEMGLREKYLGVAIDSLDKYIAEVASKIPPVLTDTLKGFRDLARGGILSGNEKAMQRISLSISSKISEGLRKLTPFFGETKAAAGWDLFAKDQITTNIPAKLNSLISYATLGGRPFRGLSNSMQFHLNVMPLYGKDAYTAQQLVDPAYIKKVVDNGLITDKMLASEELAHPVKSKIAELAMRPQQNSEYLTRAWTAKTVELRFREALDKFTKGVIDEDEFLKYSKANYFGKSDQAEFMRLIREGKIDGAEWKLQRFIIDETMFNYEKSNRGELMKGVIGTAFGKFGVFPVGQVNLYRKVFSAEGFARGAVTMARFAAMSAVVYNAFRLAGVDYSGFRMADAFSFSGGPLFTSGVDLLTAKRLLSNPDDPQAKQAYARFMRNWSPVSAKGELNVPRLAIPGYLQGRDMLNGAAMFAEGQMYGGFLRFMGAPVSADILENGFKFSW